MITKDTKEKAKRKMKIIGGGSIGCHFTYAATRMGWSVDLVEIDAEARKRFPELHEKRYGPVGDDVQLYASGEELKGDYDVILVGTPPDSHFEIAKRELKLNPPKLMQLEKPLCAPLAYEVQGFEELGKQSDTMVVVGYNYVLSDSIIEVEKIIKENDLGKLLALDTNLLAHWGDILGAHPWLSGPEDTYLGYWKKGGGASGEHSHALSLWLHLADVAGAGKITTQNSFMDYVKDGKAEYDRVFYVNLETQNGVYGRVGQDVTTKPTMKSATIRFENGHIEWRGAIRPGIDEIRFFNYEKGVEPEVKEIEQSPADSYLGELKHIEKLLDDPSLYSDSPIHLNHGLDVMQILHEAHSKRA